MLRIPRPLATINFLLAWLMPWRPAFLTRAEPSKLRFYAHWRDVFGRHLAKYGSHEPELTAWIVAYLQSCQRGIVIDVDANIGWHTVHAAKHDAVETVVAFEPDAFNAWLLDRNLAVNAIDKVIVQTCAVGTQRGVIRLYRYKGSNVARQSVIVDYGLGSRVVPMIDVDSALDDLGLADRRVLLLKIDVEGFEPSVVAGAARTLARTDAVITEYTPALSQSGGLSSAEMLDRLHGAGFVPHLLGGDGHPAATTIEHLRQVEEQTDIVWIKTDRLSDQAADARAPQQS